MFRILVEELSRYDCIIKEKLPQKIKDTITRKLKVLGRGFSPVLDVKKLRGYQNHYRLRVGKFRILFSLENTDIIVYKIGKRESVY